MKAGVGAPKLPPQSSGCLEARQGVVSRGEEYIFDSKPTH